MSTAAHTLVWTAADAAEFTLMQSYVNARLVGGKYNGYTVAWTTSTRKLTLTWSVASAFAWA